MNTSTPTLGGSLSPELCRRIARWTHRLDLPRLALACKSFQVASEKRLYESLFLGEPYIALIVCQTIAEARRLGPYVREFYIYQEDRRARDVGLPLEFWTVVQDAMSTMCNLEFLYIHDNGSNTFILDPARITFRLKSAQLHLDWDEHLVAFLSGQRRLNDLLLSEGPPSIEAGPQLQLPHLKQFAGTITAAAQLMTSPLTHIHIEAAAVTMSLESLIRTLATCRKTLRSLCIINIPESHSLKALQIISNMIPNLRYLGILYIQSYNVRLCPQNHSDITDGASFSLPARGCSSVPNENA